MTKFCLRIDIDTKKGLVEGVPSLLDLLDTYGIKGSFYIPTGGEATLLDVFRYHEGPEFNQKHIEKLSLLEKFRTILHPVNFARHHSDILGDILDRGHELGVHGHKHRHWTRGLEHIDVKREITRMQETYADIIGKTPETFAAPGFRTNDAVLQALDQVGFIAASDKQGKQPFHPNIDGQECKHVQVPINVREGRMPPIEAWRLKGLDDSTIIRRFHSRLQQQEFVSTYIHPSYEGLKERDLLRDLFATVEKKEAESEAIQDIAKKRQ